MLIDVANTKIKMSAFKILLQGVIFALCFILFILAFSADWLKMNFMHINIEQVLFHLRFPLLNKSTPFIKEFCIEVLFPSVVFAILVVLIRKALWQIVAITAIFVASLCIANDRLQIVAYLKQKNNVSTLYENHYKPFDIANLAGFTPKQNLIVIFAESLESTFSAKNIPNTIGGGEIALLLVNTRPLVS